MVFTSYGLVMNRMDGMADHEQHNPYQTSLPAFNFTKDVYLERLRKYVLLRAKEREILRKSEEAARLVERVNLARERRHSLAGVPPEVNNNSTHLGRMKNAESLTNIPLNCSQDVDHGKARSRTLTLSREVSPKTPRRPPLPRIYVTPVVTPTVSEEKVEEEVHETRTKDRLSPAEERIVEANKRWSLRVETMKALDDDIRKAKTVMAQIRAVSLPQGLNKIGQDDDLPRSRLQNNIYDTLKRPTLRPRSVSIL